MVAKSEFEVRLNIALEEARDEIALRKAIIGEDGFVETITLRLQDFGGAATNTFIAGVVGRRGRVIGIDVYDVTETGQTNGGDHLIGIGTTSLDTNATDVDYYATSVNIPDNAQLATPPSMPAFTFTRYIPASTGFIINKPLGTDSGTVAGIYTVAVTIAWMALES